LNTLGEKLRESREKQNLLLRQIAAHLEVDTAFISKAERGDRKLQRQQVIKLAQFLNMPEEELISLWLSDKIINLIEGDRYARQGMEIALKKIKSSKM
jgi:transcriptional regulator with XRE-family HTH domain